MMTQRCSAPGLKLNVPHVKLLRQRWLSFCGSTQHLQQQCAKVLHISSCGMDAQCLLSCPSADVRLLNNVSELCCSEHGRHLAILQRCGEAHLVGGDLQSNTDDFTCLVIVMASLQFELEVLGGHACHIVKYGRTTKSDHRQPKAVCCN